MTTALSASLANVANCTANQWLKDDLTTTKDKGSGIIGYLRRASQCMANYIRVHWLKKEDAFAHYRSGKVLAKIEALFDEHQEVFVKVSADAESNKALLDRALQNFDRITHNKHAERIASISKKAQERFATELLSENVLPELVERVSSRNEIERIRNETFAKWLIFKLREKKKIGPG